MARGLEPHDLAIWHTLQMSFDLAADRRVQTPRVDRAFPVARGERVFVEGEFRLARWRPARDGERLVDRNWFIGSPDLSPVLAVEISLNNGDQASGVRAPAWVWVKTGSVFVSDRGVYFYHSESGPLQTEWSDIEACSHVGPGVLQFSGECGGEWGRWMITSLWAELVFCLWAGARYPQHPQYIAAAWIPAGWRERVEDSPYDLPRA